MAGHKQEQPKANVWPWHEELRQTGELGEAQPAS